MNKLYQILLICLIGQLITLSQLQAQTPGFAWAKQATGMSGNNPAYGRSVAHDAGGNTYVTGHFSGVIFFGNTSLMSSGSNDIFIAKYNASGSVLWVQKAGGANNDIGYAITTDVSGNIYVTGTFEGTATFGNTTITSNGPVDAFLAKYDASGNIVWVKHAGGTSSVSGRGIGVDALGNTYLQGQFQGSVTFGTTTLTSNGSNDIFIVKYDAAGNLQWAQEAGGTGLDFSDDVAVDEWGNTYLTGQFTGTASFGSITLTSSGNTDIFIAKYNASGNVLWAQRAGGQGGDRGYGIAVDGSGNAYITGEFSGLATFGNLLLMSSNNYDVFIAKYDASGQVLWAQQGGGPGLHTGYSIAVDGAGNSCITGRFSNTATFGNTILTSNGNNDIFITRYDASGNQQWALSAGGAGNDTGFGISLDGSGNTYVTGFFTETASFGSNTLTSNSSDVFIAKHNAFGQLQWVQQSTGYTSIDYGRSIAADREGNTYATGYYQGTATFGTTTLTSNGNNDIFIVKYDTDGNALWAKSAGGTGNDIGFGIAVDGAGNVYVTGHFMETISFGSTTLTSSGFIEMFIAKYDASGNVLWAKKAGGVTLDIGYSIAADESGNAYVTGNFNAVATFDNFSLTSSGFNDVFIAKYDASGNVLWAQKAGGTNADTGFGIAVDGSGNAYITGEFSGTATFGNTTLTSSGLTDIFIAKYDASGNAIWAHSAGGAGNDRGNGITADNAGNTYITGQFQGTVSFGNNMLSSDGNSDMFIAGFDGDGNLRWAQKAGGTANDTGFSIALDGSGNPLVTGDFTGTATFGTTSLNSGGGMDVFIAKYDVSGNVLWATSAGGTGNDRGYSIAVDGSGNAYITGFFYGDSSFGSTTLSAHGNELFIVKIAGLGAPTRLPESKLSTTLAVYPNPVNDKLQLALPLTVRTAVELRLLDASGKVLLQQHLPPVQGEFKHTLDLKDKASGIYLLQLVTEQDIITKRIVKE